MQKVIIVNGNNSVRDNGDGVFQREDLPAELNQHLEDGWSIMNTIVANTHSSSYYTIIFMLVK